MITFEKTEFNLGNIKLKSTNHRVEFPFKGSDVDIEDIVPLCGCTKNIYMEHNSIVALYNNESNESNFDKGIIPIDVAMKVFLRDGKPLKTKNVKGFMDYNPDKAFQLLRIKATVVQS